MNYKLRKELIDLWKKREGMNNKEALQPFKNDKELFLTLYGAFFISPKYETSYGIDNIKVFNSYQLWYKQLSISSPSLNFKKYFKKYKLQQVEIAFFMLVISFHLNGYELGVPLTDVLRYIIPGEARAKMNLLQLLLLQSNLFKENILYCDSNELELEHKNILMHPEVLKKVSGWIPVKIPPKNSPPPPVIRYQSDIPNFICHLFKTFMLLGKKQYSYSINHPIHLDYSYHKYKADLKLSLEILANAIKKHPRWKISQSYRELKVVDSKWTETDWHILLLLAGKTLCAETIEFYQGDSIAAAVSEKPEDRMKVILRLTETCPLRRLDLIQIDPNLNDNYTKKNIYSTIYELTQKSAELLGISEFINVNTDHSFNMTTPELRFKDLILPERVRNQLRTIVNTFENRKLHFKELGLNKHFECGTGTKILLYGPPGTGKTATANAFCCELSRPLITIKSSQIIGEYMGETEKNIDRAFQYAEEHNAVLFWDEVDGLLTSRKEMLHNYEIRIVNLLLKLIEDFEGVCIFATNSAENLDEALDRRISFKIELPQPDRKDREKLWKMLMPSGLILSDEDSFSHLASYNLSGGQIKNVIMRLALNIIDKRNLNSSEFSKTAKLKMFSHTVNMMDVIREINNELKMRESEQRQIGFAANNEFDKIVQTQNIRMRQQLHEKDKDQK